MISAQRTVLARNILAALAAFLVVKAAVAQTATDACSFAAGAQYTVNTSCTYQTFDKPGSFGADINPGGSCSSGNFDDAFGWFTATGTTTNITFNPSNNSHDAIIHLWSGTTCGGLTYVNCSNSTGSGNETLTQTTTIGTRYLIRIQRNGTNNGMDGSICIWSTPPAPSNDNPCSATSLTVATTCSYTAATNVSATNTAGVPAPTCANYTGGDVWFRFTAPASGNIQLDLTANGLTDTGMELYSATACGGTFTSIECDDDDGAGFMSYINQTGLTPGTTYYVRVWGYGGATGTFNICAFSPIPPTNDNPCGATALTLGTSCTFSTYNSTNATATAGIPTPGCGTYSGGDVWFSFVAPSSGLVTIRTGAQSITNLAMALYSATACNGTFTLIECDDNDGIGDMPFLTFSSLDLVAGQTYYLRVWQSGSGAGGTFNLCANTAPVSGSCMYVLRMNDLIGDGWGGGFVSVQVGAAPAVNYTLTNGNQDVVYIPVTTGNLVQVSYTAGSGPESEISYFLQLGQGIIYQDGPPPGTGLRFAAFANCTPPAPPTSDCAGGTRICDDLSFSASPSHTGIKADLNVNNRGCLGADERQGTWYNFTPSLSGTIEMTIAPTNSSDDYDFAIWGPMVSLACPPTGAPSRCSYSGASGNTGLRLSSSDVSEGSGGDKWVSALTVVAGEVYILYISNFSRSGLAFDLSWTLTNGASLNCTLLPVEFLSFDGKANKSDVALSWSTASELNSSHFVVERSSDGQSFEPLGQVMAAGMATTTTAYAFTDTDPGNGTNYYRLRQVDTDGTSQLTDIIAVRFGGSLTSGKPYPNPAQDLITTEVVLDRDASLTGIILDAAGRTVRSQQLSLMEGIQQVTTPLHGLDAGHYQLLFQDESGNLIQAGHFVKN